MLAYLACTHRQWRSNSMQKQLSFRLGASQTPEHSSQQSTEQASAVDWVRGCLHLFGVFMLWLLNLGMLCSDHRKHFQQWNHLAHAVIQLMLATVSSAAGHPHELRTDRFELCDTLNLRLKQSTFALRIAVW